MSAIDSFVLRFGDVLRAANGETVMFLTHEGRNGGWTGMFLSHPNSMYRGAPGEIIRDYVRDDGPQWVLVEAVPE